jgi:hypothetical protein
MRVRKAVKSDWSIRIELSSGLTDFREIRYFSIFPKSVEKIKISLKFDENNLYLRWRPIYNLHHISLRSS